MSHSRSNPSNRYLELIELNKTMHTEGDTFLDKPAETTFPGLSLLAHASRIKRLLDESRATSVLDYGAGKGRQYEQEYAIEENLPKQKVVNYWGVDYIHLYDPCYEPYSKLPSEKYDGVICTDVLEHCSKADIPWILEEIFSFSQKFVFASIACYPAEKTLANGDNAHETIESPGWWQRVLSEVYRKYDSLVVEILFVEKMRSPIGKQIRSTIVRLGNSSFP